MFSSGRGNKNRGYFKKIKILWSHLFKKKVYASKISLLVKYGRSDRRTPSTDEVVLN